MFGTFRLYYWISAFFMLLAMEAFLFVDRILYGNWADKSGDKITQGFNVLLILTSLVLFGNSYRRRRRVGFGGILALLATAYLFLTALWSVVPETTVREAIIFLFIVLGAIGVAGTLSANEFMDVLGLTCFWAAVASLFLLVASPANALMPDGSGLMGVFPHKNFLGQVMATGVLAVLHSMAVDSRRLAWNLLMLFVLIVVGFASKSATAWLVITAFCCVNGIITLCRRKGFSRLIGILVAIVSVPVLLFVAVDPDAVLEMIGKDPTLTGRTDIWAFVINDISLKPLLGWGYFGFWSGNNPAAVEISIAEQWVVPQAHNGLLEMLVNIGFIGTTIFIITFVRNVVLACRCIRTPEGILATSTIIYCMGILIVGVSETILLAPTQCFTPVFFITGLMCEQAIRAAKRRRRRDATQRYSGDYRANSVPGLANVARGGT